MLNYVLVAIRFVGSAVGVLLNLQIEWSSGQYIYMRDILGFIFLIFVLVKLILTLSNNQVVVNRGGK